MATARGKVGTPNQIANTRLFLGYNPMRELLGPVLPHLSHAHAAYLTGRTYFPRLMSKPFSDGLHEAFDFAIGACLIAAAASWMRGGKYVHGVHGEHAAQVLASTEAEMALADGD